MVASKKKFSIANRRLRERSNFSFLFVLFFIALFCIIIVMETVLPKQPRTSFHGSSFPNSEEDEELEEYNDEAREDFNFDVSFDDKTSELKSSSKKDFNNNIFNTTSNKSQMIGESKSKKHKTNNTNYKGISANKNSNNNSSTNNIIKEFETDWQQVSWATDKFYVYSAYFVNDHIKIIGATKTHSRQIVQCRFYNNKTEHYSTVDGKIKTIRENWNLRYSACFIICNLPSKALQLVDHPTYVSVTAKLSPSTSPSNRLRVQYASDKLHYYNQSTLFGLRPEVNFSLCVKPIYLNYDNVLHFLETMEFHRLMGVNHFTFFNHSIGPSVGCIMREVYNSSLLSILPWSLPFKSQKEIRTEGIFAALNDCVYRTRGISKYLVIVDLDEAIVPRKTNQYSELISQLNILSNKKQIGAYSFQNAFFYTQFDDDPVTMEIPTAGIGSANILENSAALAQAISRKLLMLRKTRRRARFNPHKERSKYICDPKKVIEAGNHFVWEMEKGYYTLSVPTHLAALHHYRVCEFGGSLCIKNPSVVDKTVENFSEQLISAVTKRLQEASIKCQVDISVVVGPGDPSS